MGAPLWAGSAAGAESEAAVLSVTDLQTGRACHFHCLGVQLGQQWACCGEEEEEEEKEGQGRAWQSLALLSQDKQESRDALDMAGSVEE